MIEQKTQELMSNIGALLPLIVTGVLTAIGAIVILLIGLWLSRKVEALTVRTFIRRPHLDPMLGNFFGSLARYLILTVTVLAVLSQFGVQTTSLIAVLGAASLAVGLALQGTLSNLAAGVMLLIFRPFRIGHKVQISGNLGTVRQLSLFWTELVGDDQVQVLVPNGGVWGQALRNYSVYTAPPHLGEVRFPIADEIDLERAIDEVNKIIKAQPQVLPDPAPKVLLDHSTPENALEIVVAFSTADDDTATVKSELIKAVHGALRGGPLKQASP